MKAQRIIRTVCALGAGLCLWAGSPASAISTPMGSAIGSYHSSEFSTKFQPIDTESSDTGSDPIGVRFTTDPDISYLIGVETEASAEVLLVDTGAISTTEPSLIYVPATSSPW